MFRQTSSLPQRGWMRSASRRKVAGQSIARVTGTRTIDPARILMTDM